MPYAIYPPLAFPRIGNSPNHYLAAEGPDVLGIEVDAAGNETPVARFKDANYRMKRKGVRFTIFELMAGQAPRRATLPNGTVVRWRVSVANRKDAIHRPAGPPAAPQAVSDDPAKQDRVISASAEVAGPAASASLDGRYRATPVHLGDVATDAAQRLVFLGGAGRSASISVPPDPIGASFYTNPGWFDDVCDGMIEATIEVPGAAAEDAQAAWVVTTPPDFAPPAKGVVTLYDVMRQVAIDAGWIQAAATPWFDSDIRPMIDRAARLRWVDANATWDAISRDWAKLSDASAANRPLREQTVVQVREVENALNDFTLRDWQNEALDDYAAGNFQAGSAPGRGECDVLTRTALDETVGQGFFPGIEAGINITDPQIYATPFDYRFRANAIRPGDATAHMAQPWQADFKKCNAGWWPAQRPAILRQQAGGTKDWLRPNMTHAALVQKVMQLGVATPDAAGEVHEEGRDPALGA